MLIAIAGGVAFWQLVYRPYQAIAKQKEIIIKPGDGSAEVARLLVKEGVVRPGPWFLLYVLLTGKERDLRAGRYLVSPAMNIPQLVEIISSGRAESEDTILTIPEGFNLWEIDRQLTEQGLIKAGEFVDQAQGQEGYLFPDTYRLKNQKKQGQELVAELIVKMRENFREKAGEVTAVQLIVASLLEKEVRTAEDMTLVAGIINERLKRNMFLQIDASVAYGACLEQSSKSNLENQKTETFQKLDQEALYPEECNVTQVNLIKWLKIDTPYNTYLRLGLPPGPISNPGQRALEAARHPQSSEYLYYLSRRVDGQTIFSRTAGEHEKNRQQYR